MSVKTSYIFSYFNSRIHCLILAEKHILSLLLSTQPLTQLLFFFSVTFYSLKGGPIILIFLSVEFRRVPWLEMLHNRTVISFNQNDLEECPFDVIRCTILPFKLRKNSTSFHFVRRETVLPGIKGVTERPE